MYTVQKALTVQKLLLFSFVMNKGILLRLNKILETKASPRRQCCTGRI